MSDFPVKLPSSEVISGHHPIVFIGPNGAGKTRFGKTVADLSGGDRIPALRSLAFAEKIAPRDDETAKNEVNSKIGQYKGEVWRQADEFNELLAELQAEEDESNAAFKRDWEKDSAGAKPKLTSLGRLKEIWSDTFPGRTLDFIKHRPVVTTSTHRGGATAPYNANTMSDGERAALHIIARVLRAPSGVVVVDEPEVHFHGLLARALWDRIERARSDCRFVYITHDLPFALSRRDVEIGIIQNDTTVRMVPKNAPIPPEIVEEILGAASLSLVAKRIVFCEGMPGQSIDARIYGAWFRSPGTAVVPVGSCRAVRESVHVFEQDIVSNAQPLGIIERDYWPEGYLLKLSRKKNLHVLPTQEIEGLLCLKSVAAAISQDIGHTDFGQRYKDFEADVRANFVGEKLNKVLLERIKCRLEGVLDGLMGGVSAGGDFATFSSNFEKGISSSFTNIGIKPLLAKHEKMIRAKLAGGADEFLPILPGKDCLHLLTVRLGISPREYTDKIADALSDPKSSLGKKLERALRSHLPPR